MMGSVGKGVFRNGEESSIEADLMYDFFVGGICQMMIAVIIFSFL